MTRVAADSPITRALARLRLAAWTKPSLISAAAWEAALRRVMAEIAGGPAWVRVVPKPESQVRMVAAARDWPDIFAQPLYYLRKDARTAGWDNTILIGRPKQQPPEVLAANVGCGVWFAEGFGLLPDGRSGLTIASDFCIEMPDFSFRPHFISITPEPSTRRMMTAA